MHSHGSRRVPGDGDGYSDGCRRTDSMAYWMPRHAIRDLHASITFDYCRQKRDGWRQDETELESHIRSVAGREVRTAGMLAGLALASALAACGADKLVGAADPSLPGGTERSPSAAGAMAG